MMQMTMDETRVLGALKRGVGEMFDRTVVAHDLGHIERVERNALRLLDKEGGNHFIVRAACLMHDFHRVMERDSGSYVAPEQADAEVERVLSKHAIERTSIDHVCACIHATEMYRCAGDDVHASSLSVEQRIVRDADMLDALGAVGIARAFMFGGHLGEPLWAPTEIRQTFQHGHTASVVHHFFEKLLHLHEEMLTDEGMRIAVERTRYMRAYLDALKDELGLQAF